MVIHGITKGPQRRGALVLVEDSSQEHSAPELFRTLGNIEQGLKNVVEKIENNEVSNETGHNQIMDNHKALKTDLDPLLSLVKWLKMSAKVVVVVGGLAAAVYGVLKLAEFLGAMQ